MAGDAAFRLPRPTRTLNAQDAAAYHAAMAKRGTDYVSPYQGAIAAALRELTGRDAEPTAAAWRRALERAESP